MAIRDWRYRHLLLLWGGGIGVEWFLYWLMFEAPITPIPIPLLRFAWAILILIVLGCLPLGMVIVTWQWLRSRP